MRVELFPSILWVISDANGQSLPLNIPKSLGEVHNLPWLSVKASMDRLKTGLLWRVVRAPYSSLEQ